MNKKQMRREMLFIRNSINKGDIIKKSKIIWEKLSSNSIFQKAKNIMFFASFGTEVYTHDMIRQCMHEGKNIVLPYIDRENTNMQISVFKSFDHLELGYKNILEIKKEHRQDFDEKNLNVVITPCVCYDLDKYRIGYGKGFYDRFFNEARDAFKIGLCFEEMLVDKIEYDENDIKVDMVITDMRVII